MPIYLYEVPRIQHWNVLQIRSLIPSWPEPVSLVYLSVYLSFHRTPPCRTNNNESNEAKSRSGATCARNRWEISTACRKMQDEISLPAAFLGRKISLGKLRSLLFSCIRRKVLPSFLLIFLLFLSCIAYTWYRIEHAICFPVHYPVHSNKCISHENCMRDYSLFLSFSLYSYRIQFAREIVPLIRQHGNKCSESREIQVWREIFQR